MLFTLGETRAQKQDVFYVTQMTAPSKATALSLLHDYYPTPQSLVWMNFGSAFHIIIERSRENMAACGRLDLDFDFERRFSAPLIVAGRRVELHGRADQYRHSTATLTDYKAMGTYSFKKLREGDWSSGYDVQLNLYRKYLYPHAKHLQLACLLRDYTEVKAIKDRVRPTEYVVVPHVADDVLEDLVQDKIQQIMHTLAHPDEAIPCTPEERWYNKKSREYIRCERYCSAAPWCDQARKSEAAP